MRIDLSTTLNIEQNKTTARHISEFLKAIPQDAEITFKIQKGYDTRMSYAPDRVTGIVAKWTQGSDVWDGR